MEKLKKRFYEKFEEKENGCWEWNAHKNKKGYGVISVDGKPEYAHRISYMIFNGKISEGLIIRHICDNPKCVNPNHLILGTHKDNMLDMMNRNRGKCQFKKGITPKNKNIRSKTYYIGNRPAEKTICKQCKKEFLIRTDKKNKYNFCSKSCSAKHRYEKYDIDGYLNGKSAKYIVCKNCSSRFLKRKDQILENNYCSNNCRREHRNATKFLHN